MGFTKKKNTSILMPGASLCESWEYLSGLIELRNNKYFHNLDKRLLHFISICGELTDTVRAKEKDALFIPIVAAKHFLRLISVMQVITKSEIFADVLRHKYPASGCNYCGYPECICAVIRPEEKVGAICSNPQMSWSINQWQKHLDNVYGKGDREKGLLWVISRLVAESNEFIVAGIQMQALMQIAPEGAKKYKEEMIREAADVFAWLIALCNVIPHADLEKSIIERYGNGCQTCKNYPCHCGQFRHIQERREI